MYDRKMGTPVMRRTPILLKREEMEMMKWSCLSAVTAGFFIFAAALLPCLATVPAFAAEAAQQTETSFWVGEDYQSVGTEAAASVLEAQGIPSAGVSGLIWHEGQNYVRIDTKPRNETVYIPALDQGNGYIYAPTTVSYSGGVYTALYLDENDSASAALVYSSIAMPAHQYRDDTGNVAYCLNRPLAYPSGACQTVTQGSVNSSKLTAEERALVQNVLENGYPLNSAYWSAEGYTEDAQEYATQLAVWCVLKNASGNDSAAYDLIYGGKAVNVSDMDVLGMVKTLYQNAVNGSKVYDEPAVTVTAGALSYSGGRLTAEYAVASTGNSGFALRVISSAGAADTSVRCNGTALTAEQSGGYIVGNPSGSIEVSVPADTAGNIRVEVFPLDTRGSVSIWWTENTGNDTQDMAVVRKEAFGNEAASAAVETTLPTAAVSIIKTAQASGEAVAGAVYGLYTTSMTLAAVFPETDENGSAALTGLPLGVYLIKEISAPSGYVLSEQVTLVDVTDIGAAVDHVVSVLAEFSEAATAVSIMKTDGSGQALSGAALRILAKQDILYNGKRYCAGETVAEWVSAGEAYVINALPAGEYALEEVCPPFGYASAKPVEFTVLEETSEVQYVTMSDRELYGKVVIRKTDGVTGEAVGNAEFTLVCNEAELYGGLSPSPVTAVTDENGEAVIESLPIGIYGSDGFVSVLTYTLYETEAPSGYLIAEPVTISFVTEIETAAADTGFAYAEGGCYALLQDEAGCIIGISYTAEITEMPAPEPTVTPEPTVSPEPDAPPASPPLGGASSGECPACAAALAAASALIYLLGRHSSGFCIRKFLFSLTNRIS